MVVLVPDGEVAPVGEGVDAVGVEDGVLERTAVDPDVAEVAPGHALEDRAGVRVGGPAELAAGRAPGPEAGQAEGATDGAVGDRRPAKPGASSQSRRLLGRLRR